MLGKITDLWAPNHDCQHKIISKISRKFLEISNILPFLKSLLRFWSCPPPPHPQLIKTIIRHYAINSLCRWALDTFMDGEFLMHFGCSSLWSQTFVNNVLFSQSPLPLVSWWMSLPLTSRLNTSVHGGECLAVKMLAHTTLSIEV